MSDHSAISRDSWPPSAWGLGEQKKDTRAVTVEVCSAGEEGKQVGMREGLGETGVHKE